MKIVQIVESFGGGVITSVSQICNILAEAGHEVHLAYSRRAETPDNYKDFLNKNVQLHEMNLSREISLSKDLKGLLYIYKLLRELRPDVVHLHSSKAGFLGRIAAFLYRLTGKSIRIFYSPRGFSFMQHDVSPKKIKFFVALERFAYLFGGTIIPCSGSEGEVAKQVLKVKRIKLVENAVDSAPIPIKVERNDNRIRVGTLGRATYQKNPQLFIEMARHFKDIDFVWIGGGEEEEVDKLKKNDNITVTGWLPRKEALEVMASLDIYIQTSFAEGMPLAVIEGMIAGLPPVLTDVVGNRDVVIHGKTGYLTKSETDMKEYLGELIASHERRESLGQAARHEALNRFGLKRLRDDLFRLYGINHGGS